MARVRIANRPGEGGLPAMLEASSAVSLLNALLGAGIRIRHDCGGKAICGTCAVRVLSGGSGLSPVGPRESERLAATLRPAGYRLACQSHATREVTIEVAEEGA